MYLETEVYEQKVTSVSEGQITDTVLGSYCLLPIQSSSASKLMIAVYRCYSVLSFGCIKTGRLVSNRRSEKKLFKQYRHYNFGHLFAFVCLAYAFHLYADVSWPELCSLFCCGVRYWPLRQA